MKHYLAEELRDGPAYGVSGSCHSVSQDGVGSIENDEDRQTFGTHASKSKNSPSDSSSGLLHSVADICAETKGQDILGLDLRGLSDVTDFLLIVSGRSDRQVQGICNRLLNSLAEEDTHPISVEGLEKGHWVVLDFGELVVHVFYEPAREHYDIEALWAKAPRVKNLSVRIEAA